MQKGRVRRYHDEHTYGNDREGQERDYDENHLHDRDNDEHDDDEDGHEHPIINENPSSSPYHCEYDRRHGHEHEHNRYHDDELVACSQRGKQALAASCYGMVFRVQGRLGCRA